MLADLAGEESRVARRARPAVDRAARERRDAAAPRRTCAAIAVVGPIADSARELLGDYAHLLHIETLLEMRARTTRSGFPLTDEIVPVDELAGRRTILDAVAGACADADRGATPAERASTTATDAEIEEAVELGPRSGGRASSSSASGRA